LDLNFHFLSDGSSLKVTTA